jgi:hypothetical protein
VQITTTLDSVRTAETRGGNTRYAIRDVESNEHIERSREGEPD